MQHASQLTIVTAYARQHQDKPISDFRLLRFGTLAVTVIASVKRWFVDPLGP